MTAIEQKGAWLLLQRGSVGVIADEPHECPVCHRMTYFFVNRDGRSTCTGCEGKHELA